MFFDIDSSQGEWFYFFNSHIDPVTGEPVYEEPVKDARVQIRSIQPFIEERFTKKKKVFEHIYNPKTRSMERMGFYPELTPEEAKAERDDLWDYAITGLENFKDSKTGRVLTCDRETKLALMKVPVFDRFVARCQQLLASAGVKAKEDNVKN
jgi:hypothetical protein